MSAKRAFSIVAVTSVLLLSAQGGPIGSWFTITDRSNDQLNASIAYNSQRQEYLVVWWNDQPENDDVWGQRVSRNGTLSGPPFLIAYGSGAERRFPAVAYNSQHDEYLVVWQEEDASYSSVRGRRVSATGWLPGGVLTVASGAISDVYCGQPAVAYASTADRYLVIYDYGNTSGWLQSGIAARAFTSDGSPDGNAFDARPYGGGSPTLGLSLAYNRARNEFLVVWSESADLSYDVWGRRVKMAGGAGTLGDIFRVSVNMDSTDDLYPAIAAIPFPAGVGQYLVAWESHYTVSDGDIYAQPVAGDGTVTVGPAITIANPTTNQTHPAVDGSDSSQQYLVTWSHPSDPPFIFVGIRGRAVSTGGALLGKETGLGGIFAGHSAVAAGPPGDFLVAYDDVPYTSDRNIYGRLWGNRIYLPLVQRNH